MGRKKITPELDTLLSLNLCSSGLRIDKCRREFRALLAVARAAAAQPHAASCAAFAYTGPPRPYPETDHSLCNCWKRAIARLERAGKEGG